MPPLARRLRGLGVGATLAAAVALGRVDNWLAREFAPHRVAETLRALAEARPSPAIAATNDDITTTTTTIAECDRKLAQYRATLDAGANSDTVAAWIAETEAEKASYALAASKPEPKFADVARVLINPGPDQKAEIFRKLGLNLACHPARYLVIAQVEAAPHWSLWRRMARALGKVLACLAHRHGRPAGGGADVSDRREQDVLPEVVALPPGDLIKQIRLGPAAQGRCGQHRVPDFVVLPAAEGALGQEPLT